MTQHVIGAEDLDVAAYGIGHAACMAYRCKSALRIWSKKHATLTRASAWSCVRRCADQESELVGPALEAFQLAVRSPLLGQDAKQGMTIDFEEEC